MKLNYDNVVKKVIEYIPELKGAYDELMSWLEEPLCYSVFEMVVREQFFELIKQYSSINSVEIKDRLKDCICKFLFFFEKMAESDDTEVVALLEISILEISKVEMKTLNSIVNNFEEFFPEGLSKLKDGLKRAKKWKY